MKKVLLTGASGFIGRHAIKGLLSRGYEIHAVSNTSCINLEGVFSYQCDLLNFEEISQLVKKVSASHLLHFAWYTYPGKYWGSELNIDWVKSSLHLVQEFIHQGGKRVVISGTCAEYDWSSGLCKENETLLKPSSLYGVCKSSLYQIVDSYAKQMGFSSAWGRVFFLHGPHEYPQRLVPSVIQRLILNEIAECSHGMQIRDFLHVEDAGDAFCSLVDSEVQGAINIASGKAITIKEVINKVAIKLKAENQVHFGAIPTPQNDAPCVIADITRLASELNWKPKYTLDDGLEKTILWWKELQKL